MEAAASIMRTIEERHEQGLGRQEYTTFKAPLRRVAELQRRAQRGGQDTGTA